MNRYRREDKFSRSNKKSPTHNRLRRGNSRGQHQSKGQPSHIMTASPHAEQGNQQSGPVTTVESLRRPPLPLLPPPLASVTVPVTTPAETRTRTSQSPFALATDKPTAVRHLPRVRRQHCRGKAYDFTRCSCSRLVQRPAPISLDRCLACWVSAQHVVPCIRLTQRHGHTYFCEEPTCSFTAFYEVSRRYAGDGSLRLERRPPRPGHGSLRFTCRSAGDGSLRLERRSSQPRHWSLRFRRRTVGDGSPRFERLSPQLRRYSGDRSLRLGRRSSQPRHGGPRTNRRPLQPRAAQ